MPVNKRKKASRHRGSHTHGWGAKKKHRGKGHQGGAGMGGTGKRADSKKPSIWKERYFGKRGFVKKNVKLVAKPVNVLFIDENVERFVEMNLAKKDKDVYEVDIADLGFNKLLGKGKIKSKIRITVPAASKKAVEAVKNSGGDVITKKVE